MIIETADRYTTQDRDASGWSRFLRLLRRTRSRRGLNGVFAVIG